MTHDTARRPTRGLTLVEVLVILAIVVVLFAFLLPATRSSRGAARRALCVNNLKAIALGASNYGLVHGVLPPASTLDPAGRPLQGWRALLLPHIGMAELYGTIDLAEGWDAPANSRALEVPAPVYRCLQSSAAPNATTYLATLEPSGCLIPGKSRRIADITDGTSSTLLLIEAGEDRAVPWMAPRDADESTLLGFPAAQWNHAAVTNAVFVDGSVSYLRAETPPRILRALTTVAGGEDVGAFSD